MRNLSLAPSPPVVIPLLLLEAGLVIAWSSGFVGMRFALDHAPVFLVVFWRCVLLTLCLLPWVARSVWRTPAPALLRQAAIGLLAMACYLAGVAKGIEHGVPAGMAALIADLLPVGTALIAACVLRHRLGRLTWAGLGIGLAGTLIVLRDALALGDAPAWAYAMPLLGMLALAVATSWQKRDPSTATMDLLPTLWIQCAVSTVFFGVLAGQEGSLAPVASGGFAAAVLWTAMLSSLGGYGLYWLCLRRSSPTRVASVLYLSPAATLLWAWSLFGEPLTWLMLAGTAVCGAGVWLVARGESRA